MSIHTATAKGRRRTNEDTHIVKTFLNPANNPHKKYASINMYSVFDGHGGTYVSKYLHEHLYKYFICNKLSYPLKNRYINQVYNHVQDKLTKENELMATRCGSTALVALHYKDARGNNNIQVLNTGDCRAVLCRDNIAIRLTKDHKPSSPEEAERIRKLGGKVRVDGNGEHRIQDLSVSRAFGDNDTKPYVVQTPDICRKKIDGKDKFLVLACDGLWDVMSDQDVVDFVLSAMYNMESGSRTNRRLNIAKKLTSHAIQELGTTDNVTLMVVFFN
jgi:serine/threonine protein phosphatase PrpC